MGIYPNKKVATSSDGSTKEVDVIVIPTGYQHPFLLCGRKRLADFDEAGEGELSDSNDWQAMRTW
jgi:hypothetical protein